MDAPIKATPSYNSSTHGYFTLEQQTGTLKTISREHVLTKGRKEKPDIRKIADHVIKDINSCTLDQLHLIKDSFENNRYKHSWAWLAKKINKTDDARIIEGLSLAIAQKTPQPSPEKPQEPAPGLLTSAEKGLLEATHQFTQVQKLIAEIATTLPQFGPLVESDYKEAIENFNHLLQSLQNPRTKKELQEEILTIEAWTCNWKTEASDLEQVLERAKLLNHELLSSFPNPAIYENFRDTLWEDLLSASFEDTDRESFQEEADNTISYELRHLPLSLKKECKDIQLPPESPFPECRNALNRLKELSSTWEFLFQNLGTLGEPFPSLLTSAESEFYEKADTTFKSLIYLLDFEKKAILRLSEMSLQQLEKTVSILEPYENLIMYSLSQNLEKRKVILEEVTSLLPSFRDSPLQTRLIELKGRIESGVSDEGLDAIHNEIIHIMQEHQRNVQEREQALAQEDTQSI